MTHSATHAPSAEALAKELELHGAESCSVAIVLGSGLGALAETLENPLVLHASDLEHLPASAVAGHAGRLVIGELAGTRVLIQQGRVHQYEGWSPAHVTCAVRAFGLLGIPSLILTNAAGCLQRSWQPGSFMRITDHLNLQGAPGLLPEQAALGPIYSERLGDLADRVAAELEMDLHTGVYAGLPGPSYETPAEIRMLQSLGADAVGMSTVAEAAAAKATGMEVLGLSCLTNFAAGIEHQPLKHEDVVRVGADEAERFRKLCTGLVAMHSRPDN